MADFNARHYRMIAKRLAESKTHVNELTQVNIKAQRMFTGIYIVERKLIELFEADNPLFNKAEFEVASEGK